MVKDNITLIGMPGSGKSTLGVLLAKYLNYNFLDTDLMIQTEQNMKLQEIIDKFGQERFNEIENDVNSRVNVSRTVIAPGGSVVYGDLAMKHLRDISTVIYLSLSFEEMERRIKNPLTRGISMRKGETLKDLYETRVPLYKKYAHIVVECDGLDVEQTLLSIEKAILNNN